MDARTDLRRSRLRIINRLPYLHEEIIEEILIRLPVKSLTRFKCVSKSWCSVINDKRFIKAHIKKSSTNPSFSNHKVIGNVDFVQEWSLLSLLHEPSPITPVEYEYPLYVNEASDFIGCCDGLVCILICGKDFILWNPATKEFNLLPSIVPNDVQLVMYGFGYDKLSDDYKVFGLLSGNNWVVVKVYSLKTDSWRIANTNIPVEIDPLIIECGTFVCGKLHWTTMTVAEPKMIWDISLFDLESECYGSLELPNHAVGDFVPYVGAVEGSLCLVCDYATHRYFDIWIMKEYNVRDSWHKMATLPYPMPCDALFLDPLFVGGNGEILFACDGSFVVYHPREARFSHPRLVDSEELVRVHVYVESLVSPVPAVQTSRTTDEMMKLQLCVESQFE